MCASDWPSAAGRWGWWRSPRCPGFHWPSASAGPMRKVSCVLNRACPAPPLLIAALLWGSDGFLRLEYGLWHGQSPSGARPDRNGARPLRAWAARELPELSVPPGDLSLRAHEILENTLQFELTGATDEGSHTNLATAWANVQGTGLAVDALRPALSQADPQLTKSATSGLERLGGLLAAHRAANGTGRRSTPSRRRSGSGSTARRAACSRRWS